MANRCERAFDDVGRAQMFPVLGGKVVKGEQRIAILDQTLDRLVVFDAPGLDERRIGRSDLSRAAENIAYGHADFADTLKQWINSAGHRANLLLHGAKWIGVAHAQNGHRTYWAMVIGAK